MVTNSKKIMPCLLAALWRAKRSGSVRSLAAIITKGLCLVLLAAGCTHHRAAVVDNAAQLSKITSASRSLPETQPAVAHHPKRASFAQEPKSQDAQRVADWAVDSADNCGMPFVIVDKRDAKVFVFHTDGRLRGAAPVLLGLAKGDDSIPGIGDMKMSDMRPEQRTTPAGRFVASLGYNFHGKDILWVDYDGALSMHRVVTSNPKERRLERLTSPTTLDNRISFGCINVPAEFFNNVVTPAFTGTQGIVYILPEIRSNAEIFTSFYDVELRWETAKTADLTKETKVERRR